jgi:hypothetical protein
MTFNNRTSDVLTPQCYQAAISVKVRPGVPDAKILCYGLQNNEIAESMAE